VTIAATSQRPMILNTRMIHSPVKVGTVAVRAG
jgi:hypothetical protein